jgi:hypothetical protein
VLDYIHTYTLILEIVYGHNRNRLLKYKEELIDLYCSPAVVCVMKSRRMRWLGHVTHMVEGRGVYRVLVGKPEGKRPLRRPRHRWEDNMWIFRKWDVGWIDLVQDRDGWQALKNAVMKLVFHKMWGIS